MHRKTFLGLLLLAASAHANAQGRKDPRLQPITREQLVMLIAKTPLNSPADARIHGRLVGRAYASKLVGAAYVQYNDIWRKQPNNPYANFFRGNTALMYHDYASYPSTGIRLSAEQKMRLQEAGQTCMRRAVELKPDYAPGLCNYGTFLFNSQGQEQKGLAMMQKAVELEPKNPAVWRVLGESIINPYRKAYDPRRGEEALLKAVRLDPLYAAPHYALIRLYTERKRYKEAQRELQAYASLVSAKDAASTTAFFKPQIDRGLSKR